jgi:predicted SprT family Zn-dependent metalloprotease
MNTKQRSQILKEIKAILKINKVIFKINLQSSQCYSYPSTNFIHLGLNSPEFNSRDSILSAVFHELAHLANYQNKKYFLYHNDRIHNQRSIAYAIRYGLKAEQHTDLIGKKMMLNYDPKSKFIGTYHKPEMKRRYKAEFLTQLINY